MVTVKGGIRDSDTHTRVDAEASGVKPPPHHPSIVGRKLIHGGKISCPLAVNFNLISDMIFNNTLVIALASLSVTLPVSADLVFGFEDSGTDMIITYAGSLDFTGMAFSSTTVGTDTGTTVFSGGFEGFRYNTGISVRSYSSPWASSPAFTISGTAMNSGTTLTQQLSIFDSVIYLDPNDFTGDVWFGSGSTTFANTSVSSILDMGSEPIVWTLNGSSGDTITWQAGAVPEPSTYALLTGLAGIVLVLKKRISRAQR
jgi:hypothetical protein